MITKYSETLHSMGLNCTGPLTHAYFSIVNTMVLHDPQLVELLMQNHEYGGIVNTEGPLIQSINYKVIGIF